jgi:hypothetical protein
VLLSFFRVAGWACVVVLIVLSLVPGNERPHTGLPGQIEHLVAYCGTAALLGLGYPTARARFGTVAMLALLAAVLEMIQLWIPDRHSQFFGFFASSADACLGVLAVAVIDRFGLADRLRLKCVSAARQDLPGARAVRSRRPGRGTNNGADE